MKTIVEQIHHDFKSINDKETQADRVVRLSKLGLVGEKLSSELQEGVIRFPGYKLITERQVRQLCEKWNLLHADLNKFKGEIPDKNLSEASEFADKFQTTFCCKSESNTLLPELGYSLSLAFLVLGLFAGASGSMFVMIGFISLSLIIFVATYRWDTAGPQWIEVKRDQPIPKGYSQRYQGISFSIIAPEKLIDLSKSKKVGHKVVADDPIILAKRARNIEGQELFPVTDEESYYVIVTAWGDEAKDVFNEQLN